MKFTCNTKILSDACQNVARAASTKGQAPALDGILIEVVGGKVCLSGYNLEMGISTEITARDLDGGDIVLNANILCGILKKAPGDDVSLSLDRKNIVTISSGTAVFSLVGIPAKEFPKPPELWDGTPITIEQGTLKGMIRQTIFAAATNDTKAVHTGIKFEISDNNIKLIAVDGFRLAIRTETINYNGEPTTFIVPAKTLSEVVKLFHNDSDTVTISAVKKHIVFSVGDYTVISRLLEGEFLNYKAVLPAESKITAAVNTRALIDSIERTSLIIADQNKSPLRCLFRDNRISVSCSTPLGSASDAVDAVIDGDIIDIGFNHRYLTDALKVCETDEVKILLNASVAPVLIKPPKGDSFTFLVLPVRLKEQE